MTTRFNASAQSRPAEAGSVPGDSPVPVEALRFAADVEIAPTKGADPLAPVPVTVFARSVNPIDHWYWGRVVHDMSGMFLPKDVIPFDYCHSMCEILGSADEQQVDEKTGLTVKGQLVPFQPDDRASEVIFKSGRGVPYEASINWGTDGIVIEQIAENAVTQVNGYEFAGPGVVVRKWPLRGVAICPYGADSDSAVMFKQSGATVPVTYLSQESAMPTATENKPADEKTNTETTAETAAEAKPGDVEKKTETQTAGEPAKEPAGATQMSAKPAQPPGPGQKFLDAFGDVGGTWFAQGLNFEEAQTKFAALTRDKLAAQEKTINELKTQLTAVRGAMGEKDPVTFQAEKGPEDKRATQFAAAGVMDNTAKIAAAIKLPKSAK